MTKAAAGGSAIDRPAGASTAGDSARGLAGAVAAVGVDGAIAGVTGRQCLVLEVTGEGHAQSAEQLLLLLQM